VHWLLFVGYRLFPFNQSSNEVHVKAMSELMLLTAVGAVLKVDKLEVVSAELGDEGIRFEAKSKSGQVRVKGIFCDPQGELALEEPAGNIGEEPPGDDEPAANADEEDEPAH
jgi:extradiol dioxygenase family protein